MGHNLLVELEEKVFFRWFIPSPAATTGCLLPDPRQDFLYFLLVDVSRAEDWVSPVSAETRDRPQLCAQPPPE